MALSLALPATATAQQLDAKAGVDAWGQGDYQRAIAIWRPLAEAGDADAQFNLGQAYKLGRGVTADAAAALEWFRKASASGHLRAQDNYGLLLFQEGRRAEAMPYLQKAAERGEPRAQYLYGTALFNGEFVEKDWVRAYAMMRRAADNGLQPASTSLVQMDMYIPADQRRSGSQLAEQLKQRQQAMVMAAGLPEPVTPPPAQTKPRYVKPAKQAPLAAAPPAPVVVAPKSTLPKPAAAEAPKPAANSGWRIQLGAFSEEGRAQALWKSLSAKVSGLSAYRSFLEKGGGVTRLQAGSFASQADADRLCIAVKAAGNPCMPRKM